MAVYVHYKVPLVAEVEVETGEVLSVNLDDKLGKLIAGRLRHR